MTPKRTSPLSPPSGSKRTRTDPLQTYRAKRRFGVTGEPRGSAVRTSRPSAGGIFVVQKHAATRLHYDFRLEHGGALWSWAVPKGPSLDPKVRRLAARTEDHPIEYAAFEGAIPKGEYGGGTVIVWDEGRWIPDGAPGAALAKGHLAFDLEGKKLRGRFHLVRLPPRDGQKESWLLFKSEDEHARTGYDAADAPESVKSGRTLEDVRESPKRVWRSNRSEAKNDAPRARTKATRAKSTERGSASEGEASTIDEALRGLGLGFSLTNLDKVLYPEIALSKSQLLAYYASVAQPLLRFAGERPLSLVRAPDGWEKQQFFQKHPSPGMPGAVRRLPIRDGGRSEIGLSVDGVAGVVALGQMGVLEVHTWLCRIDEIEQPDQLVIDIDPDTTLSFARVVEAAFEVRSVLARVGLVGFVKTTGGKGLHVVAPLVRGHAWDTHKSLAHALVERIAADRPKAYVTTARKDVRGGKIFLDYLRNGRGATAIAPYSPRARSGAPVAVPVRWEEIDGARKPLVFGLAEALGRSAAKDPWADYEHARRRVTRRVLSAFGL